MANKGNFAATKQAPRDATHRQHHENSKQLTTATNTAKERPTGPPSDTNFVHDQEPKQATTACSFCSQEGATKHCRPCKFDSSRRAIYCNNQCQKQHWKEHKKVCLSIAQKHVSFDETAEGRTHFSAVIPKVKTTKQVTRETKLYPSVTTTNVSNDPTQDYVVKFSFKISPKQQHARFHIAKCHSEFLQALTSLQAQVFNNNGVLMPGSFAPASMSDYETHFKLHFSPGNIVQKRGPLYTVFHRIKSTMTLGSICQQPTFYSLLIKHKAMINLHIWKEDEVNIVNLGFHIGVDPANQPKAQFEDDIRSYINEMTGTPLNAIPFFQSGYSRPYHNDKTGRSVTKSYSLQCRRDDAKEMIHLLQATFQSNPLLFAFHKLRHTNSTAYKEAIETQNEFLKQSRAIPIHGISEDLMSEIAEDLHELDGIYSIQRHKLTTITGRWNLMTDIDHFRTLISQIKQLLSSSALLYVKELTMECSFPPIALAFNTSAQKRAHKPNQPQFASVPLPKKCEPFYSPTANAQDKPKQHSPPSTTDATNRANSFSSNTNVVSSPNFFYNQHAIDTSNKSSLQVSSSTSLQVTSPDNITEATIDSDSNSTSTYKSIQTPDDLVSPPSSISASVITELDIQLIVTKVVQSHFKNHYTSLSNIALIP
jgi:hypothetical protein